MIYEESIKYKKIYDPLFSSIKKYLENQLTLIIAEGNEEKIKVAKQRYEDLRHTDVQIEPGIRFDNGKIRACFVSRTRGFFHADAIIEKVTFNDILTDFNVKPLAEYTESKLRDAIKTQDVSVGLYQLTDTVEQVLVLDPGNKTIEAVYQLLGKIHWYEMTLTIPDTKDPVTERSGSVLIKSLNMDDRVVPIYYKPHLQE
ncbi:hypothetical protein PS2_0190 [Aeromonas phage PS2]|uniref:Uncharacterized protein n=1 Tax=Aeromonas phage PS1 TaxID=2591406 RepID=A0A514TUK6_9CAUD|nr:hypothetical protein PQC64_gp075 [Aeromonas phage PS1]QDJ96699.1 hypothetical protein PS1_0188 [Aeromonas phage PS1]QFR59332.1 hypothetical protein PS2_0190 [Aeromonas phage PS2]